VVNSHEKDGHTVPSRQAQTDQPAAKHDLKPSPEVTAKMAPVSRASFQNLRDARRSQFSDALQSEIKIKFP